MAWTAPTIAAFKEYFARDFNYAPASDPLNTGYIIDADISKAIAEAGFNFNAGLGGTDGQVTAMFMYLTAHFLVTNIKLSSKGLASQGAGILQSTSVGSVSVNYAIPEKYLKSPILAQYTTTGYGMKYLEMVMKYLVGRVNNVAGTTTVY